MERMPIFAAPEPPSLLTMLKSGVVFLYNICILKWFIDIISPQNDMKGHLKALLAQFPNVDVTAMGFPELWENEPLWQ